MGIRITTEEDKVALFDSVTGLAFGQVFDSAVDAQAFLDYAEIRGVEDVRKLSDDAFNQLHDDWQRVDESRI